MMLVEKACTKCLKVLQASAFYTRKDSPDGLRNQCKACRNLQSEAYRKKRTELLRALKPPRVRNRVKDGRKVCSVCNTNFPVSMFHRANASKIRSACKACTKEIGRRFWIANKERLLPTRPRRTHEEERAYRASRREQTNACSRRYMQKPEIIRHISETRKIKRDALDDDYIKHLLIKVSDIPPEYITTELINAKKAIIKLKRLIKEKQK